MVTRDFISTAASAWRAAGCNLQRPDVYDAATKVVAENPDIKQLAHVLDSADRGR